MAKGEEIFGRDALAIKTLRKLDKGELDSTIEINLIPLVEYYYDYIHHKEEREYRTKLIDLVLNKKLFLKPISRIYRDNEESIPEGLAFIIWDSLKQAGFSVQEAIAQVKASNLPAEEIKAKIEAIEANFNEAKVAAVEVLDTLTAKTVKKLKKLGMKKDFAFMLAPALFSEEYVTPKNMFRFIHAMTTNIYDVVAAASIKTEDGVVNGLGVDLSSKKAIGKLLEIVTKSMDLGTYGEFIKQLLLEKRDNKFDALTQQQLAVYAAITNYALGVLEDKNIFSNKSRQEILKSYGIQVSRDIKRGRDARRRVVFTELEEDSYPRIVKALRKITSKKED